MRKIRRKIASAVIFSKDHKVLMGKKDATKGGVFTDYWHIPGGEVEKNETIEQALKREVLKETGIDISLYEIKPLAFIGSGVAEKMLKTGEKVLCSMEFNRFEININDKNAADIEIRPTDDLVEMEWFNLNDVKNIKQIPGDKEFFIKAGYINKD